MTEQEFRFSTPEHYMLKLYGMNKANESASRERWEIARWQSMRSRTAMVDKFPPGFWELPWDSLKETLTVEEWELFNAMMDEKFPRALA